MADPKIRIRATDETGPAFRTANANVEGLASSASGLLAKLGGTLIAGALFTITKSAIDAADELGKLSQRTGVAIETLGGLGYASELAGGSLDSIADAADKLNRQLAEAASGQKLASEAFDALGISAVDASGKTKAVDVAMAEIADRFAEFADGPEKAALAMRLFGKSGVDQIALLNQGGAALREQIAYFQQYSGVSEETSRRAEVFNDTLSQIGLLSQSLGNTLASSLLPSLQAVADAFLRAKENGTGFEGLGQTVRVVFDGIALSAAALVTQLSVVGKGYAALFAAITNPRSAGTIFSLLKDDIRAAYSELGRFKDRLAGIGISMPDDESAAERRRLGLSGPSRPRTAAPRLPGSGGAGGSAASKRAKDLDLANKELARYAESLETATQRLQDLSTEEEALIFLRKQGGSVSTDEAANILNLARQIDATKALNAAQEDRIRIGRQFAIEEGDRIDRENEALAQRTAQLLAPTATAKLAEARSDMVFLTDLFENGRIGEAQYLEAVSARLDIAAVGYEKLTTFAEQAAKNIQDSIGDGLANILEGNFSNIAQNFTRMINRMVAEAAAAKITESLFGKGGNGGGFLGDVLGSFGKLLSFDGGGSTGNRPRTGGIDGRGGFLAVMHGNEDVIDRTRGQSAGRSVVVTINQLFAGNVSRATGLQAAADARRQLEMATRNL